VYAAYAAVPCRIDRRDRNSGGGPGPPLDFGLLQRTLLDIDFPPSRPVHPRSPLSLSISALGPSLSRQPSLPLVSPSRSTLSHRGLLSFLLAHPFVSPRCPCSSPLALRSLLYLLRVSLPTVRSSPERRPIWRHRTKCVKAWRDTTPHTHSLPILLFTRRF